MAKPKPVPVRWLGKPAKHDFAAAENYLSLVMPAEDASRYRKLLEQARALEQRAAKDILRASGLPLLPKSNVHVAKDLARIRAGVRLSPVLLIRGNSMRPLIVADGYHRVCGCEWHDENTLIPCVIV